MRVRHYFKTVFLLVLVTISNRAAIANDTETKITLDDLVENIRSVRESMQNVSMKYSITVDTPPSFFEVENHNRQEKIKFKEEMLKQKADLKNFPADFIPDEVTPKDIQTHVVSFLEKITSGPLIRYATFNEKNPKEIEHLMVFDGTLTYGFQPKNKGQGLIQKGMLKQYENWPIEDLFKIGLSDFSDALKKENECTIKKVADSKDTVYEINVVEKSKDKGSPFPQRSLTTMRLNITRSCWPESIVSEHETTFTMKGGTKQISRGKTHDMTVTGWHESNGISYPKKVVTNSYSQIRSDKPGGENIDKIIQIQTLEVSDFTANAKIDKSTFRFEYPVGSIYLDDRDHHSYKVLEGGKTIDLTAAQKELMKSMKGKKPEEIKKALKELVDK